MDEEKLLEKGDPVSYNQLGVKIKGIIVEIHSESAMVQSEDDLISVPLRELTKEFDDEKN